MGHGRPQLRAADPDIHHRADGQVRGPPPLPCDQGPNEGRHPFTLGGNGRRHVDPSGHNGLAGRSPQGGVQSGTAVGDVDRLAPQHRLDPRRCAGPLGQGQQQLHSGIGDQMPGPVDHQLARGRCAAHGPVRVGLEQSGQVHAGGLHLTGVAGQRGPLGGGRDVAGGGVAGDHRGGPPVARPATRRRRDRCRGPQRTQSTGR